MNGIDGLLRTADARRKCWHHVYHMWRISLLCGSGVEIEVETYVTHRILIPTDNIIMLDW